MRMQPVLPESYFFGGDGYDHFPLSAQSSAGGRRRPTANRKAQRHRGRNDRRLLQSQSFRKSLHGVLRNVPLSISLARKTPLKPPEAPSARSKKPNGRAPRRCCESNSPSKAAAFLDGPRLSSLQIGVSQSAARSFGRFSELKRKNWRAPLSRSSRSHFSHLESVQRLARVPSQWL